LRLLLRSSSPLHAFSLISGGYNHPNAARAFATFTSIALGRPPLDPATPIPEEGIADEDWESYGPSFEMRVPVGESSPFLLAQLVPRFGLVSSC
jgi:hypothetical protein